MFNLNEAGFKLTQIWAGFCTLNSVFFCMYGQKVMIAVQFVCNHAVKCTQNSLFDFKDSTINC